MCIRDSLVIAFSRRVPAMAPATHWGTFCYAENETEVCYSCLPKQPKQIMRSDENKSKTKYKSKERRKKRIRKHWVCAIFTLNSSILSDGIPAGARAEDKSDDLNRLSSTIYSSLHFSRICISCYGSFTCMWSFLSLSCRNLSINPLYRYISLYICFLNFKIYFCSWHSKIQTALTFILKYF